MMKRFAAIIMLLAMAGGVTAGAPLRGEQKCPMGGAFDCCAVAQLRDDAPQVSAARLCCALNCAQPGTQGPSATFNLPQFSAVVSPDALALKISAAQYSMSAHPFPTPRHRSHSPPAYIRHLALLI